MWSNVGRRIGSNLGCSNVVSSIGNSIDYRV